MGAGELYWLFIPVEVATNKDEVDSYKVRVGECEASVGGKCGGLTSTGVNGS